MAALPRLRSLTVVLFEIFNSVIVNNANMLHIAISLVVVHTISYNEEVGDDITAVIALVTAAERSILFKQSTSLSITELMEMH